MRREILKEVEREGKRKKEMRVEVERNRTIYGEKGE
jgi:hypothetical protein